MQAEIDRHVAANGGVMPDSGRNAPRQALPNNCPMPVH
jgi:hypothetical protein